MQKFLYQLKDDDRRTARKWSLIVIGFYGSILAGLIVYAALQPDQETNLASAVTGAQASLSRP
jgi:hypothetical protein